MTEQRIYAANGVAGGSSPDNSPDQNRLPTGRSYKEVFDELDTDRTGNISRAEFEGWLESVGNRPSLIELDEIWGAVDENGDGVVDFAEFSRLVEGVSMPERTRSDSRHDRVQRRGSTRLITSQLIDGIRERLRSTSEIAQTCKKLDTAELHQQDVMKQLVVLIERAAEGINEIATGLTQLGLEDPLPSTVPALYKNSYRLRDVLFLHFAVVYSRDIGIETLKFLLKSTANPNAFASYTSPGNIEAKVQAIHIAAFAGYTSEIEYLLLHKANVNSHLLLGDEKHATPLHDAAFGQHADTVALLTAKHADPNLKDKKTMQPLHIVAQQGNCVETVERLVNSLLKGKANLDVKIEDTADNQKFNPSLIDKTPLQIAADFQSSTSFPKNKLYLLAQSSWETAATGGGASLLEELLMIARLNMRAAEEFTCQIKSRSCPNHATSREKLIKEALNNSQISVKHLVEIVDLAPLAGADILEMLTKPPHVQNLQMHALPTCVDLREGWSNVPMKCMYRTDSDEKERRPCWKYMGKGQGSWPDWHNRWEQRGIGGDSTYNVRVSAVWLPNVLNVHLVWAFARTWLNWRVEIFGTLAVQGMITCLWDQLVYKVFMFSMLREAMVLVVLVLWNLRSVGTSFMWIILVAIVVMELGSIFCQRWAYYNLGLDLRHRKGWNTLVADLMNLGAFPLLVFRNFPTYFLALLVILRPEACVSFDEGGKFDRHTDLVFSLTIAVRFFKLIYGLRAFNEMGRTILSLLQSLLTVSVRQMLLVAILFFVGFFAAFIMIKGPKKTWLSVFAALFKVLLLTEGEALNDLAGLPGADSDGYFPSLITYMVTPFFSLCVLNLITAVYSDEYSNVKTRSGLLFHKSRALICCHHLLQNYGLRHFVARPSADKFGGVGAVLVVALAIVFSLEEGAITLVAGVVAAVCLIGIMVSLEAALMSSEWDLTGTLNPCENVVRSIKPGEMEFTYDNQGFVLEVSDKGFVQEGTADVRTNASSSSWLRGRCIDSMSNTIKNWLHKHPIKKGDQIVKIGTELYSKEALRIAEQRGVAYDVTVSPSPHFLWICHRDDFDPDWWKDSESAKEKQVESLERRLDEVSQTHADQLSRIEATLQSVLANQLELLNRPTHYQPSNAPEQSNTLTEFTSS